MNRFFGDDSFPIHSAANKANSGNVPYDYEREAIVPNTASSLSKAEKISLLCSVVFSLSVGASFIHADEIKSLPGNIVGFSEDSMQGYSDVFDDMMNGFNDLGRQ